jgi:hypothetical protein
LEPADPDSSDPDAATDLINTDPGAASTWNGVPTLFFPVLACGIEIV